MKNLIVLIISIIFSFFLCEIILRYILINDQLKLRVEANKKQFKDFQKLTWNPSTLSFIPNSEGFINHPEYKYIIRHDKFGFRNPCNINENIFVNNIIIGDSFVYGVGVQDSDTLNCKVSVSNYTIGVPNATPNCYLQLFKKNFPIIKKIIDIDRIVNLHIVFYVGNDFEDHGSRSTRVSSGQVQSIRCSDCDCEHHRAGNSTSIIFRSQQGSCSARWCAQCNEIISSVSSLQVGKIMEESSSSSRNNGKDIE